MVVALVGSASATLYSYSYTGPNVIIPDASPAGMVNQLTVSDIPAQINNVDATINDVSVRLNISGGYNGDLYGYLVLQSADTSTTTAILLDRIGPGTYGNNGSTINVTLNGTTGLVANGGLGDIGAVGATGNVTGTYTPDGNANALNAAFSGHNANGTWTLFLADLSGGDTSQLVSWGLDISVVPEPITYALMIFGAVVMTVAVRRRLAVSKVA